MAESKPKPKTETRGGPRPNSGRKPLPEGERKIPYGTKLDPAVIDYLRSCSNAARAIESALTRSKAYRVWKSSVKS